MLVCYSYRYGLSLEIVCLLNAVHSTELMGHDYYLQPHAYALCCVLMRDL